MAWHPIGGALDRTDMACVTFPYGADGSAGGEAGGSDAAGVVVLVVVESGGVAGVAGEPRQFGSQSCAPYGALKENNHAES